MVFFVAPTGIEPVFHAWEACVLAARRKRRFAFREMFLAEAGGFEPPVRLPARQFSKLVVSATHPNFLPHQNSLLLAGISLKCGAKVEFFC